MEEVDEEDDENASTNTSGVDEEDDENASTNTSGADDDDDSHYSDAADNDTSNVDTVPELNTQARWGTVFQVHWEPFIQCSETQRKEIVDQLMAVDLGEAMWFLKPPSVNDNHTLRRTRTAFKNYILDVFIRYETVWKDFQTKRFKYIASDTNFKTFADMLFMQDEWETYAETLASCTTAAAIQVLGNDEVKTCGYLMGQFCLRNALALAAPSHLPTMTEIYSVVSGQCFRLRMFRFLGLSMEVGAWRNRMVPAVQVLIEEVTRTLKHHRHLTIRPELLHDRSLAQLVATWERAVLK